MFNFLYKIANNYPNWVNPGLKVLIPTLGRLPHMTEGEKGEVLARFANLINYRIYAKSVLCDGTPIIVPRNDLVGSEIYRNGCYEPETVNIFNQIIKPGMVFLDIGTHVGQYTLLASKLVGPDGAVHSFEPDPDTFAHLALNVSMNNLQNVHPVQAALSGKNGWADFYLSSSGYMGTNSLRTPSYHSGEVCKVRTITLDSYIKENNIAKIDVMKLDVEGAEIDILQSSLNILKDMKPLLVVEFNKVADMRFDHSAHGLKDLLTSLGYEILRIDNDGLRQYREEDDAPSYFNVLARPFSNT